MRVFCMHVYWLLLWPLSGRMVPVYCAICRCFAVRRLILLLFLLLLFLYILQNTCRLPRVHGSWVFVMLLSWLLPHTTLPLSSPCVCFFNLFFVYFDCCCCGCYRLRLVPWLRTHIPGWCFIFFVYAYWCCCHLFCCCLIICLCKHVTSYVCVFLYCFLRFKLIAIFMLFSLFICMFPYIRNVIFIYFVRCLFCSFTVCVVVSLRCCCHANCVLQHAVPCVCSLCRWRRCCYCLCCLITWFNWTCRSMRVSCFCSDMSLLLLRSSGNMLPYACRDIYACCLCVRCALDVLCAGADTGVVIAHCMSLEVGRSHYMYVLFDVVFYFDL